ncbi:ornithine carbamoyltransferase [Sandaracinobacter sp. RS1-74]|uniref:ornithine carbamoyltransferase n=1 Tax=Sandaracinobacteroides sayramensis TaxID=2913411 RepID=UPI001ED9CE4E|nr:ornithine carbamoyltransferase [Sandaracinobacteroides sayramensis]MCG2841797.1 ornithine carbamoyltransferase [Sandaracinobacteroides sayramensis]
MGARNLLNLSDLGPGGLRRVLDHARARKLARKGLPHGAADGDAPLAGHVLASLFEKPSTRTRLSFDIAMRQLGGEAITVAAGDLQLGRGESIDDTARVFSGFVDAVMIRANRHADVEAFARAASVPVLNGLTDLSHPCQIAADLLTVEERLGRNADGTVWAWVGDGNNVCNSIVEAAGLLGFQLRIAHPEGYAPDAGFIAAARARGAEIRISASPEEAGAGADVVVTDTWVSMGDTDADSRLRDFQAYQVTPLLMGLAGANAIFLHCLPAHRGEEVADSVIDGPQSAVWDEAANRVHAQKALLLWALGKLG